MRRFFASLLVVAVSALVAVPMALAAPPSTLPAIPVDSYASSLLTNIMAVATQVLPWAAAFTAVGIGFAFLKGYIGRKKATSVSR